MTLKFHEDSDIYCLACRIEFFIPILRYQLLCSYP